MSKQIRIIGIDCGLTKRESRWTKEQYTENEFVVHDILTNVARVYDTECPEFYFNNNDIVCVSKSLEDCRLDISEINKILQEKTKKNIIILKWENKDNFATTALIDDLFIEKIAKIIDGICDENNKILLIQNLIDKNADTSIKITINPN